jgi:hypothetical protein
MLSLFATPGIASIIFIPLDNSRPWVAVKHLPYARWDTKSAVVAGTELSFDKRGGAVDSAVMMPQSLYATDRDLVEGTKVWLPEGGLLVKMTGGESGWYCTWRFDDRAAETSAQAAEANLNGFEYNLCLQESAAGRLSNPKIMIADFKALMTITDPESGMNRYRNGVGATNAVDIAATDIDLLPKRAQQQVFADWTRTVCLHVAIADMKGHPLLESDKSCFPGIGQSIDMAGGRYTLLAMDADKHFKIRIDQPIDSHGIGPSVKK